MAHREARERLADCLPSLRALAGFPRGSEESLLRLSLPPWYTACPNPFIPAVLGPERPRARHARAPFAADVSEGRSDPIYTGQVYHTKVPPAAIARYIEHHCPRNGVVFDGFCGSGMTGVAARLTGRRAVLVDLSPAATAIAAIYCLPVSPSRVAEGFQQVLARLSETCAHLYALPDGSETDYVIWSEVYRCPHCGRQSPFGEMGFDFTTRRLRDEVTCPSCGGQINARALERVVGEGGMAVEVPVRVKVRGRRGERSPLSEDLALAQKAAEQQIPYWFPEAWMMHRPPQPGGWGDMWRRGYHTGVWRVADFYFPRTLYALSAAVHFARQLAVPPVVRHVVEHTIINASTNLTRMRRAYQGPVPLVLYFPRLRRECNVIRALSERFRATLRALEHLQARASGRQQVIISTQSSACLPNIPDDCVDYIFTDPPFGQNIIYSEVNFLWESWMGVTTAQETEAIISRGQGKNLEEYRELMQQCFGEFWRILKPGRWMTVEFHNSSNEVWTAIQEAITAAGFTVEDVRILDKQQQSFKQASTQNAVQQDLVISARKQRGGQRTLSTRAPGAPGDPWTFVAHCLSDLGGPAHLTRKTERVLYTRLVQHWLSQGWRVPLSAAAFYRELRKRWVGLQPRAGANGSAQE